MSSSDDYIVITESHDMNDDSSDSDIKTPVEGEEVSRRTLEDQGISILGEDGGPEKVGDIDQFSRELMDEGGIEIVSGDEKDLFL
ncbi:MAG: hypothetical protein UU88_C0008G0009 [Parcubacteria group bacterium GW2011_GWC1_42_11]|uniref:Uncharacterized protein n=1 Tax=Candidatus Nomurabacteria bacterium GW2011_GWC2_42_20 TaxID=1618756 RepID=A0A0G0ZHP5_9BACT|nr:MAG: hypothetical protein UU88_C0008G0009 [Parcubacteria group bacterium GW2011_GWC1_42_11]KKS48232.1 MAG: hypothetical protein UV12_C0002G0081 [Candidatus Nomurabacteria bacterium GW2011_GWC2_42_20]KKS59362.1 MAG: hypothetical protein UV24_C0002G0028 [Candidatus Nomurabacteria bacterium GW2011_GWA2_42_41]KKT09805.1 MAG: hypothetical protein UV86_C0002G0048 [Candidatus Nomurabacteria bacterium GW2011_GWB1_43_20]TAN35535.1 MAG: hypothetical protein EPN27_03600 [Patescibacteria group bacterium